MNSKTPDYGKVVTEQELSQSKKQITTQPYFAGQPRPPKIEIEDSISILDRTQVMAEILKCVAMLDKAECDSVQIQIIRDTKTNQISRIVKKYRPNV